MRREPSRARCVAGALDDRQHRVAPKACIGRRSFAQAVDGTPARLDPPRMTARPAETGERAWASLGPGPLTHGHSVAAEVDWPAAYGSLN